MKNSDIEQFYNSIDRELKEKKESFFIDSYNQLHRVLIDEYDERVKNKIPSYRIVFLEQGIKAIQKANVERRRFDFEIWEETVRASELLDEVYDYFEVQLTQSYINSNEKKDSSKAIENRVWFKVGLLFATDDEIWKLKEKFNSNAAKIAREIGNLSYEKYILASLKDYQGSNKDKNIFRPEKLQVILEYCKKKRLSLTSKFKEKVTRINLNKAD